MKYLIIIMLLATLTFGQNGKTPALIHFDSGSLVSDSMKVVRGSALSAVLVDSLKASSLTFETSTGGTLGGVWRWYRVQDDGSDYTVVVDSTKDTATALKPILNYPFYWIRATRTNSTGAYDMKVILREY